MRIIVTGSRYWSDREAVEDELHELWEYDRPGMLLVGDCPAGADQFAWHWFTECVGVPEKLTVFVADWDHHGKAAGPIRNQEMVDSDESVRRNCVPAEPKPEAIDEWTDESCDRGMGPWLNSRWQDALSAIKLRNAVIAEQQRKLEAAQARIAELTGIIGDRSGRIADLDQALADRTIERNVAVNRDGKQQQRIASLESELATLRQREPTKHEMEAALGDKDEAFLHGTIRRCRHCRKAVFGGPTACVTCVHWQELAALRQREAPEEAWERSAHWHCKRGEPDLQPYQPPAPPAKCATCGGEQVSVIGHGVVDCPDCGGQKAGRSG